MSAGSKSLRPGTAAVDRIGTTDGGIDKRPGARRESTLSYSFTVRCQTEADRDFRQNFSV